MHIYEKDGLKLPSVTTIIHCLGSDDLMKWANIMGFKHNKYEDLMDKSSKFGTLVHSHLQAIVDPDHGDPLEADGPISQFNLDQAVKRFQKMISTYQYETIFTERTLISTSRGYGGTMDWLAYINKHKMINDFKTAKKPQPHMFLQLGGYFNLCMDEGITDIEGGSIINVNKDACSIKIINRKTLEFLGDAFDSLASFYHKFYMESLEYSPELLANSTTT